MGQFKDVVTKLGKIALKDPIARLVKKLVFHKELMPPMDRQQWESVMDARPAFEDFLEDQLFYLDVSNSAFKKAKWEAIKEYDAAPKHILLEKRLVHHFTKSCSYQRDQETWSREVEGAPFTHVVAALPNLSDISIGQVFFELKANGQPVWKAIRKDVLCGPDDWDRSPGIYRGIFCLQGAKPLTCVLEALADYHYEGIGEDLLTHQHRCNSGISVSTSNIVRRNSELEYPKVT